MGWETRPFSGSIFLEQLGAVEELFSWILASLTAHFGQFLADSQADRAQAFAPGASRLAF